MWLQDNILSSLRAIAIILELSVSINFKVKLKRAIIVASFKAGYQFSAGCVGSILGLLGSTRICSYRLANHKGSPMLSLVVACYLLWYHCIYVKEFTAFIMISRSSPADPYIYK